MGRIQRDEYREKNTERRVQRGRTEKNQRSEEGVLDPVRNGRGEVGVSKMETEVGVKMACPLGRRRGEMPIRECDKAESGRK